jgi:hypothetical protein
MGFFKKLKGLVTQAEEAIAKANDNISAPSQGLNHDTSPPAQEQEQERKAPEPTPPAAVEPEAEETEIYMDDTEPKVYFSQILASEFAQYQVRENVPVSEFGGEGRPYEFALLQEGKIVAFIMLTKMNGASCKLYRNSADKAKELGIPFINFYTHMYNKRSYVINRIKRMLG